MCMRRVVGMIEEPHALVLERVFGQPLAAKPNLESLLRCRWAPGLSLQHESYYLSESLRMQARQLCTDAFSHKNFLGTNMDLGAQVPRTPLLLLHGWWRVWRQRLRIFICTASATRMSTLTMFSRTPLATPFYATMVRYTC